MRTWLPTTLAVFVGVACSSGGTARPEATSASAPAYRLGRDTLRFREVTNGDVRVTMPQGEVPIRSEHEATVALTRTAGDTVHAWYEALTIGMTSAGSAQRPATGEALRQPFTLVMDPRGYVRVLSVPTFPASFKNVTDLTHQFDDFFPHLPAEPLRIGLAWSDTATRRDSTEGRVSRREAIVSYRVERDTVVAGVPAFVPSMRQQVEVRTDGPLEGQPARAESVLIGTDDGIVVFAPGPGRMLGRRRTGHLAGDFTMRAAGQTVTFKQAYDYTSSIDALP